MEQAKQADEQAIFFSLGIRWPVVSSKKLCALPFDGFCFAKVANGENIT